MRYCKKHCCYYSSKCKNCVNNEGAYLRKRYEVVDDKEWEEYVKLGWVEG